MVFGDFLTCAAVLLLVVLVGSVTYLFGLKTAVVEPIDLDELAATTVTKKTKKEKKEKKSTKEKAPKKEVSPKQKTIQKKQPEPVAQVEVEEPVAKTAKKAKKATKPVAQAPVAKKVTKTVPVKTKAEQAQEVADGSDWITVQDKRQKKPQASAETARVEVVEQQKPAADNEFTTVGKNKKQKKPVAQQQQVAPVVSQPTVQKVAPVSQPREIVIPLNGASEWIEANPKSNKKNSKAKTNDIVTAALAAAEQDVLAKKQKKNSAASAPAVAAAVVNSAPVAVLNVAPEKKRNINTKAIDDLVAAATAASKATAASATAAAAASQSSEKSKKSKKAAKVADEQPVAQQQKPANGARLSPDQIATSIIESMNDNNNNNIKPLKKATTGATTYNKVDPSAAVKSKIDVLKQTNLTDSMILIDNDTLLVNKSGLTNKLGKNTSSSESSLVETEEIQGWSTITDKRKAKKPVRREH